MEVRITFARRCTDSAAISVLGDLGACSFLVPLQPRSCLAASWRPRMAPSQFIDALGASWSHEAICVLAASCLASLACGIFAGLTYSTRRRATQCKQFPNADEAADDAADFASGIDEEDAAALTTSTCIDEQRRSASRRRPTRKVEPVELQKCVRLRHRTLAGKNGVSAYLTCVDCGKHATWFKGDTINLEEWPIMKLTWEKLNATK